MITVETTGSFMLIDVVGGQEIAYDGPTEVKETHFVKTAIEDGRLKVVGGEAEAQPEPEPTNAPPTSGRGAPKTPKKDS